MAHLLAKLQGAKFSEIRKALKADAAKHNEQGLHLEYVWRNADKQEEVYFIFRSDNLIRARQFIRDTHNAARKANPSVNLPEIIFLE